MFRLKQAVQGVNGLRKISDGQLKGTAPTAAGKPLMTSVQHAKETLSHYRDVYTPHGRTSSGLFTKNHSLRH